MALAATSSTPISVARAMMRLRILRSPVWSSRGITQQGLRQMRQTAADKA